MKTQAELEGTGQTGWVLALSLTLPLGAAFGSQESPLTLSFLPSCLFFLLYVSFLSFHFLYFCFFLWSLCAFLLRSPPPFLPGPSFWRDPGWPGGSPGGGGRPVFLARPSRGRPLPRQGSRGASVEGCGSERRQGLGYDHDRMAAALRSCSTGPPPPPRRPGQGAFAAAFARRPSPASLGA